MKFDFSYEEFLSLEISFDEGDYLRFLDSFVCLGTQLEDDDKFRFWNDRKCQIIHDIVTMYCQIEHIDEEDQKKIYVHCTDRDKIISFKCNPRNHIQDVGLCQIYHNCKMSEFISSNIVVLCENCGEFYFDIHNCIF